MMMLFIFLVTNCCVDSLCARAVGKQQWKNHYYDDITRKVCM